MALVTFNASTLISGTMQYALGTDATTIPTIGWTTDIPTATDIGTYYVWYRVVDNENHNDSTPACVTVNIVLSFGEAGFVLPSGLTTIEESAFEGMTAISTVDAHTCTSIGKNAFKDSGITRIRLPKNCDIHADAFSGCATVHVFAPAGGTTQTACDQASNLVLIDE